MARRAKPRKEPVPSATLRQVVEALREESLQYAEGELIGSEDELLARHKVSRPTLRQAAALVASEQLLQVRRGAKGGYIARRPTGRAVTHMAAIFLRSRGASLDEISRSMAPIRAELARLAAINLDDTSREALKAFVQSEADASAEADGFPAFARSEREFCRLLSVSSRNHVLSLFFDILFDLAAAMGPEHDIFLGHPERVKAYRDRRVRLFEAILDGDPSVAELLAQRVSELTRPWHEEKIALAEVAAPLAL
jgi:GntR family transcriptional regulator, transcriptional repressor for pyruvate dehydrogenase complex